MKRIIKSFESTKYGNSILRYSIVGLFVIALCVVLFFYFSPVQALKAKNNSETVVYLADNITQAHKIIIKLFNKEYKGRIRIKTINLDHHKLDTNKRKELIFRNMRSERSKVDIFAIDHIWTPRFTKWAEPLEKYLAEDVMKKILPELHFSCTYGNTIYSIPLFYDLGVLLYRRDLIEKLSDANKWSKKIKAGITWKDMFELKNKHFQNKPLYLFQAKAYEGLICNYIELGASLGTPIFRENEFLLIENNISSVIGFTLDLIHKINLVPADILQFDETNSLLFALENDIPMFRAWLTNINNIKFPEKFKEKVKNLEIALLPRKEGTSPAMALGGWNLIISKHSRHKKEAAAFLEFVISDRVQTELFNRGFYLPILAGLEATQKEQNSKMIQPLNNSWIKYSIRRPQNINYTRLSDIYSDLINKTLKGHINANDIYRIARERIE